MKYLKLAAVAFAMALSTSANAATIFIPGGNTGVQTFNYTFASDYTGSVTIGVSDEGDTDFGASLDLTTTYGVFLDSDVNVVDTSAYINALGENGTDGELYIFSMSALAGETLTFDWIFRTTDADPFNDFAFVDISGLSYEVIAQTGVAPVPVPAAVWLFGSGLIGLIGVARRKS